MGEQIHGMVRMPSTKIRTQSVLWIEDGGDNGWVDNTGENVWKEV